MDDYHREFEYRAAVWAGVVLINLPVLLVFGGLATENGGRIGMCFGIAVFWAVGLLACAHGGRIYDGLITGGTYFSLLQFIPILHIAAGIFAFGAWNWLTDDRGVQRRDDIAWVEVRGFALTILTGQPLAGIALLLGLGSNWLYADVPAESAEVSTSTD